MGTHLLKPCNRKSTKRRVHYTENQTCQPWTSMRSFAASTFRMEKQWFYQQISKLTRRVPARNQQSNDNRFAWMGENLAYVYLDCVHIVIPSWWVVCGFIQKKMTGGHRVAQHEHIDFIDPTSIFPFMKLVIWPLELHACPWEVMGPQLSLTRSISPVPIKMSPTIVQ